MESDWRRAGIAQAPGGGSGDGPRRSAGANCPRKAGETGPMEPMGRFDFAGNRLPNRGQGDRLAGQPLGQRRSVSGTEIVPVVNAPATASFGGALFLRPQRLLVAFQRFRVALEPVEESALV